MLPRATENAVAGHMRPASLLLDHIGLPNDACLLEVMEACQFLAAPCI